MSKRTNSRVERHKRSNRQLRKSRKEREVQLIIRAISMIIGLCLVFLAVLITQDIRGKKSTQKVSQEVVEAKEIPDERQSVADQSGASVSAEQDTKEQEDIQIIISAAGDCTLGSDDEFDEAASFDTMYANVGDPAYFFRNVKSIFEADDLTIVNLEGPLTTSQDIQDGTFSFHGLPEYTQILTAGSVEAVNLANNHSFDYGEQGHTDTIENVENAGIASFGYDKTAIVDVKGVKVGLIGIYVLADGMEREEQLKELIASVKGEGAQLVVVSFHWGSEKEEYPDSTQTSLGRLAVDQGADLVIGHHPHVLQGIENYNGKYIVYSLGNFCFGGNSNPSDKDTMIFQQTFTIQQEGVVSDDNVQIIPCSISSENGYNNYQPTPSEGEEKVRIQDKINSLSEGL